MAELFVERVMHGSLPGLTNSSAMSKKKAPKMRQHTHAVELRNDVQWNMCKALLLNLQTFCQPKYLCCGCLRPSRKQSLRVKGYKHVLKEISIANILKQIRVLKGAVKGERTVDEWKNLKMSHALMAYSDLDSENQNQQEAAQE